MPIFDTHCHYNLEPFLPDWQTQWKLAQDKGVSKAVVVGTDLESSEAALKIASQDDNLYASIGIHPSEFSVSYLLEDEYWKKVEFDLYRLAEQKPVAIGETGLDFFRLIGSAEFEKANQLKAFELHISVAQLNNLPLIIHVRDHGEAAYHQIIETLSQTKNLPKFILHCVSGSELYVQKALKLGGYISVAGNITYKNADHLRNLVRIVPDYKLLIETDAPFLPPQEFRGRTCEPWMISLTDSFLESECNIKTDQLYQNSLQVFSIE